MRKRWLPILFLLALIAANPLAARMGARRYETLAPGSPLAVAGRPTTLDALARALVPAFYQDPAMPGGPLREILYEGHAAAGRLSILYRTVWDDEIHPSALLHALYKPFRELYYGSARDVEYVRLEVDLASGALAAVDYQTEGRGRADPDFPLHERVLLEGAQAAGPVALRVQTWNHLLAPLGVGPGPDLARAHPALRPLEDEDRAALRLSRRTYGYLTAFGPGRDLLELPIFGGALLAAMASSRLLSRRRAR